VKTRLLIWLGLAALLLSSGVIFVDSGDVAVIYRFGAVDRVSSPGLGLRAPWPIESHETVGVSEVRRIESGEQRLLTGDTNLVDVDLIIQYTIADPVAYLLSVRDPEALLTSVVFSVTSDIVATMGVDVLLTTGRAQLQRNAEDAAQVVLDTHEVGVRLLAVEVREVTPPPAVLDAFKDVSSARGDRDTLALAAEAYVSKHIPEVRGVVAEMTESSRADGARRLARASGDVSRFQALVAVENASPRSTRMQLWTETVQRIGTKVKVHVLRQDTEVHIEGFQ
jgi:membrane protease subunit HflK